MLAAILFAIAFVGGIVGTTLEYGSNVEEFKDYAEQLKAKEDYTEDMAELAEEQAEVALDEIEEQRRQIEQAYEHLADLERLEKSKIKTQRTEAIEDVRFAGSQTKGKAESGLGLSGVRKTGTTLDVLAQISSVYAKQESRVNTQADQALKDLALQLKKQRTNLEGSLAELELAEEQVELNLEESQLTSDYTLNQIQDAGNAATSALGWQMAGFGLDFLGNLAMTGLQFGNFGGGPGGLSNEPTMLTQNYGGGYTYGDYYGWGYQQ